MSIKKIWEQKTDSIVALQVNADIGQRKICSLVPMVETINSNDIDIMVVIESKIIDNIEKIIIIIICIMLVDII